jgi:ATP-dependent Clp protease ATP-binding subunit ClpC
VLRAQVPPGSTVLVEPGEPDTDDEDVKLSVIEPAPTPTPVGVGAEGGPEEVSESSDAVDPPTPSAEGGSATE